jgi:hypothetical protein
VTHELDAGPLPGPIAAFIDGEFEIARARFIEKSSSLSDDVRSKAEDFIRGVVARTLQSR